MLETCPTRALGFVLTGSQSDEDGYGGGLHYEYKRRTRTVRGKRPGARDVMTDVCGRPDEHAGAMNWPGRPATLPIRRAQREAFLHPSYAGAGRRGRSRSHRARSSPRIAAAGSSGGL